MMNCASSVTENGSSEHMLAKINPQNKIFIIIQYINHKNSTNKRSVLSNTFKINYIKLRLVGIDFSNYPFQLIKRHIFLLRMFFVQRIQRHR